MQNEKVKIKNLIAEVECCDKDQYTWGLLRALAAAVVFLLKKHLDSDKMYRSSEK